MPLTCDDVRAEMLQRSIDRLMLQRSRPRVTLYDKEWENPVPLVAEISMQFEELLNDTGAGETKLYGDNKLADWLLDNLELEEDVHIVVDMAGKRWSGKANEITDEGTEDGREYITISWTHEYEHVKHITCFCNPLLLPEFQYPKLFAYAGPSATGVRVLAFLNLLRRFAPLWALPEDLFDPSSWLANMNPANWPIVVLPGNPLEDTSMWAVISTRMGMLHDVVAPTLADCGLKLVVTRWMPGDPQPAPTHFTLTKPTLLIDVQDISGFVGITGTAIDGALRFVTSVADDLINEVAEEVDIPTPAEYGQPGYKGTVQSSPWVLWRNAHRTGKTGISSWKRTTRKASAGAIVTGGHSPDWVNSGLKLLVNAALGYIGLIFANPGLVLGIFDSQVEDVVLAFHRVANPFRQAAMGIRGPSFGEHFESTGGTGFSLSALQAIRAGFWRTRAFTSYRFTVLNGAPFWIGRHFDVGTRVSGEVGRTNPHIHTDHCTALKLTVSRTQDPRWTASIGQDNDQDMPGAMLSRQIEQVRGIAQAIGVGS